MRELKALLTERFEAQSLSTEQLAKLQSLSVEKAEKSSPWTRWHVAAIALISFIAGAFITQKIFVDDMDYAERIAAEVVRQHLKAKPLEFTTSNIDEMAKPLAQMGFAPVRSQMLAQLDQELVGGRHCSLQGVPAAQLRLDHAQGHHRTLYQVPYQRKLFGPVPAVIQPPIELINKGVPVKIWQEQGMLFVLAGAKATTAP